MLLDSVAATSTRVAATSKRKEKTTLLAADLEQARDESTPQRALWAGSPAATPSPNEARRGPAYLSGQVLQGRPGVGYASLRDLGQIAASSRPQLRLQDVRATLEAVTACAGSGSKR